MAYARGGVSTYWIVNLVARQLEIYTDPVSTGYRREQVLKADEQVVVLIDGIEVGRITVSDLLPRAVPDSGTGQENNP